MLELTTIKDEKIILAREIKSRKGRQEHRRILLEGTEILDWAIEKALSIEYILATNQSAIQIAQKYPSLDHKIYVVSDGILKKVTDTNYVIPVVGVAKRPLQKQKEQPQLVVVLDSVQDFGNIGTIIRTCQAFGIQNLISTTTDMDMYQRKTIEASRGSVFATHLDRFQSDTATIEHLKREGYQIVATSPKGMALQSLVELKQQPVALIIGNETTGISPQFEKQADFLLQIPMYHTVESLNVGVAAGISIYEIKLKQVLTMIEKRIKSTFGRELNVTGMLVQKILDAELKKVSDLSGQQVIFMMVLKCDKRMRQEDVCKQFGILENEMDDFFKPMLKSGLIMMDEEFELTKRGEEALAKLWLTVENTEAKILSDFPTDETNQLRKSLNGIQEKCLQLMSTNKST